MTANIIIYTLLNHAVFVLQICPYTEGEPYNKKMKKNVLFISTWDIKRGAGLICLK